MTVAEMIAELQKCDPKKEVYYVGDDDGFCVTTRTHYIKEFPDNVDIF